MNNLPKEIDERIGKEAVEAAKKRTLRTASYRYGYEDGYYDGATAEATLAAAREKQLVEALKDIARQKTCAEQEADEDTPIGSDGTRLGDIEHGYDCIIEVAREALTNYAGKEGQS